MILGIIMTRFSKSSQKEIVISRFLHKLDNYIENTKRKTVLDTRFYVFGGSAGFANQRLLPNVNRVQPKGVHTALP